MRGIPNCCVGSDNVGPRVLLCRMHMWPRLLLRSFAPSNLSSLVTPSRNIGCCHIVKQHQRFNLLSSHINQLTTFRVLGRTHKQCSARHTARTNHTH